MASTRGDANTPTAAVVVRKAIAVLACGREHWAFPDIEQAIMSTSLIRVTRRETRASDR
jgi:hypothetical protein